MTEEEIDKILKEDEDDRASDGFGLGRLFEELEGRGNDAEQPADGGTGGDDREDDA